MTEHIANELSTTIDVAEALFRSLANDVASARPEPERWTIKEVVGHLIDSAANNHQRFVRAQFVTEFIFPKYEQNDWVSCQHYNNADWYSLIDLWSSYNRHLVHVIAHVAEEALEVRCLIGPYEPATLKFLLEDYVVHLKHHLKKIAERLNIDPQCFA